METNSNGCVQRTQATKLRPFSTEVARKYVAEECRRYNAAPYSRCKKAHLYYPCPSNIVDASIWVCIDPETRRLYLAHRRINNGLFGRAGSSGAEVFAMDELMCHDLFWVVNYPLQGQTCAKRGKAERGRTRRIEFAKVQSCLTGRWGDARMWCKNDSYGF